MVPFAGWEMPVQYEGVIPEHRAVRTDCGVFDVSHMGELEVEGPRAHELLQGLLSNDLDRVAAGRSAVHAADERARRDRRRPDRLPARSAPLPAGRQRLEPRGRLRVAARARDPRLGRPRRLRRVRAARRPGPARARAARPAGRASVHLAGGRARRRRVHGQLHRLHGRARGGADDDGRRRPGAVGPSRRPRSRARAGSAPATRCGSRPASRCTATTSGRTPTRSPPGSAGRARSRRTSRARTSSGGSRSAARRSAWRRS